jgi:hypothetical protein
MQANKIEIDTSESVSKWNTILVEFVVPYVDTSLRMSCYLFQLKFLYPCYVILLHHLGDSLIH